jgi:hypothetical protein
MNELIKISEMSSRYDISARTLHQKKEQITCCIPIGAGRRFARC